MIKGFIRSSARGFTLIELLVVIAIIGILAGIVLASLNSARGGGVDSAVKADLSSVRTQAEVIYSQDTDYDAVCGVNSVTQNSTVAAAIAHITSINGSDAPTCGGPASGAASNWAVAAKLSGNVWWCVDSTGVSRGTQSGGGVYTAESGAATAALTNANDLACN